MPFFPLRFRTVLLVLTIVTAVLLTACGGSSSKPSTSPSAAPATTAAATPGSDDGALIGKPQTRSGVGDVDLALLRYGESRKEMIDLIQAQGWYKDGLTSDEKLFVERMLSFVVRYGDERAKSITDATITGRLFLHDKVRTRLGDTDVLLIYEPGQDAVKEMSYIKAAIPALEAIVGVEWPERFVTVINGDFNTNDFNEGQFIRIARCCVSSGYVLAHELAHTYWSMAAAWFNEGMADLYASLTQTYLADNPPQGWRFGPANLDTQYDQRTRIVARQPDMLLQRRLGSQGLYDFSFLLLMDLRRAMGVDNFERAAKQIYVTSDFNRYTLREKRLEDLFLANTPPEARDGVMALFNKSIWGDNGEKYRKMVEQEGP
jgi:hypothetical protein